MVTNKLAVKIDNEVYSLNFVSLFAIKHPVVSAILMVLGAVQIIAVIKNAYSSGNADPMALLQDAVS